MPRFLTAIGRTDTGVDYHFQYATESERRSARSFDFIYPYDLFKVALQVDSLSLWSLVQINPYVIWEPLLKTDDGDAIVTVGGSQVSFSEREHLVL